MSTDLNAYWAMRTKMSYRNAADREAAATLLVEMYRWSKRQRHFGDNRGAWVSNMEFTIWQSQIERESLGKPAKLLELSRAANGWWIWSDGVVFVRLSTWTKLRNAYNDMAEAREDLRAAQRIYDRFKTGRNGYYAWAERRRRARLATATTR